LLVINEALPASAADGQQQQNLSQIFFHDFPFPRLLKHIIALLMPRDLFSKTKGNRNPAGRKSVSFTQLGVESTHFAPSPVRATQLKLPHRHRAFSLSAHVETSV